MSLLDPSSKPQEPRDRSVKTLAVDGTNILVRAQRASKGREISYKGIRTGPLLIFVNSLTKHVREYEPDSVVVCFDASQSQRRRLLVESYKANRIGKPDSQSEYAEKRLVQEFLSYANVMVAEVHGLEADELIGAYWRDRGDSEFIILSGDKDFMQLCDDGVTQVSPDGRVWTYAEVYAQMQLAPEDIPKAKALAGDPKDGVPGLRSIGMKTAATFLKAVGGDLEKLLAEPELREAAQSIRDAYACVSLREIDVPVPELQPFEPVKLGSDGYRKLEAFLQEVGFEAILRRLQQGSLWRNPRWRAS